MSDHEEDAPGGQPEQRAPSAKLFLGGLSWDTTEEKLRDHFGKYGSIVEAVVMRDRQTGRPRGFGFVTFTTPAAADAVVQDVHVIDGRQIDAKKSVPQELKPKARKVFVGGLSPETTEDQFKDYFSQFGEVVEAQIMQDHMSGRSRGFG
jgi:heterogeneous nuclear ribonucleoprotein A1/A3